MFKVGDTVLVRSTGDIDCTAEAWKYISVHPKAIVKAVRVKDLREMRPGHTELALEFPDEFVGGHYCSALCARGRGQFVMAENVELCFEDSRVVNTVPRIEGYEEQVSKI